MEIPVDVSAFTKIYGQLFRGGELALDRDAALIEECQDVLRKAWAKDPDALGRLVEGEPERPTGRKISFGSSNLPAYHSSEQFHLLITPAGLEIEADDIWSFTRLAFLRDYNLEKTQICANPQCKTPYFLQSKRGQIYCSHRCAVAANVRRFREERDKHGIAKKKKKRQTKGTQ
jgi:hypothetical protein